MCRWILLRADFRMPSPAGEGGRGPARGRMRGNFALISQRSGPLTASPTGEAYITYKGAKTSNAKNLEIGSKGGSCIIRFSNTGIGNFISNDEEEVKHNGELITKIGATEQEVSFTANFDLILQINKIKYKTNITLNLPCEKICEEGTTTKEITDTSKFVFKRIK